ncbi:hypothetical protein BBK82_03385 [Lentzea guizhouensis]|uniref:Phage tail protein n=1 Tax=Lentzea guizhouensis TaxID=1586287 RepID=A0A1B2HC02_9PSEU|nr:hypothetical protein [Lentzea guizhouensis]ANZ35258.1 hypothetical protein BBK82_03385 [Lentzea guizhouensis]
MAEGFKIAEAFVDVVLRDHTDDEMQRMRDRIKNSKPFELPTTTTLKPPSPSEQKKNKEQTEKQTSKDPVEVPTKLKDPVNDAWKAKVDADIRAAAKDLAQLPVDADTERIRQHIAAQIQEIQQTMKADIPLDVAEAAEWRRKIRSEVDLVAMTVKAKIPVEVDESKLDRAKDKVRDGARDMERDMRSASNSIRQSTGAAANDVETRMGGAATRSGVHLGSLGRYAAIGLGVVPPLAIAGAGAIAAIAPAAFAAAAGIASIGLAFGPVIGALKGYAADQKAAGAASGSSAASQLADAMAIRDANRAITDAKRDQVEAYEDAADQIAAAERRVEDANRSAADAQDALTDARRRATEQLEDLQRRVEDASLSEEGATLSLETAKERLKEVMGSPLSTDLEKRRAEYDVKQAENRLKRLQEENARTRRDLEEATAAGIEGDEQVIDARERLADANRDVADAQKALADAHEDAAERRRQADERVARAIEHLADVQAQQAASAGAAGGATSKFAEAMAKLTPEGRAFVEQLISMKPLLDDLSKTAQQEMLPGFTKMLKDSETLFPIFKQAIGDASGIIGDLAARAGDLFRDPVFQGELAQNFANGMTMFKAAGDVGLQLFRDWVELGAQAKPVTDALADGLHFLGDGVSAMFDALAPHMGSIGSVLRSVFQIAGELLGPIGELTGMFADGLAPILDALVPVVRSLARGFLSVAEPLIDALSPALTHIIEHGLRPLTDLLGGDQFQELMTAAGEAFGEWWMVLAKLSEPLSNLVVQLLPLLLDLAMRWLEALEPIWPEVQNLASVIADELSKAIIDLAPHLPFLIESFVKLVEAVAPHIPQLIELAAVIAGVVIPAVAWLVTSFIQVNNTVFGPLADAIAWALTNIPAAWEWIKNKTRENIDLIREGLEWFGSLHIRFYEWINRAKDAAIDRFWALVDWVRGLPGRLLEAAGNFGDLLWGKGQDFVRGLWNGISSMGSWLRDKIWNWVKAQIPAPVKDALGIHSPSKVAEEIAREVPAGMVIGLDAGSKDLERASLRLASTIQSGITVGGDGAAAPTSGPVPLDLGAAGLSSGGGSTITIQQLIVQVQGVVDLTDPYAMTTAAREFVVRLREALRQVEASQA